jgi:hypothetical protein
MQRIYVSLCIAGVLVFSGVFSGAQAQERARDNAGARATAPATPGFGLGSGGRPTARRLAASQAATRAVALCSGLWDGGRTVEQIDADNGGVGGTEAMQTNIDSTRKIVSVKYSDAMPPRVVVWRPVLGCAQLPIGATEDAIQHLPRVASDVVRPDFDARDWPMGDQKAMGRLSKAKQKTLDDIVAKGFDGTTYGGRTWGIVVVKDGKIVAERYAMGFDVHQAAQTHSAA